MTSSNPSEQTKIELDTLVYRLGAIKKAAYKFGDRCYVRIEPAEQGRVNVFLRPKKPGPNLQSIVGEFENEVLDQELREVVALETAPVRNLILAQAFSATSLLDPIGEAAEYHDDPLNIQDSDEQKRRISTSDRSDEK